MHACHECHQSAASSKTPQAAVESGLGVGKLPGHLQGTTVKKYAAVFHVRANGYRVDINKEFNSDVLLKFRLKYCREKQKKTVPEKLASMYLGFPCVF